MDGLRQRGEGRDAMVLPQHSPFVVVVRIILFSITFSPLPPTTHTYSNKQFYPRPGTPAAKMTKVPTRAVKDRSRRMTRLFEECRPYAGMEGSEVDVSELLLGCLFGVVLCACVYESARLLTIGWNYVPPSHVLSHHTTQPIHRCGSTRK